MSENKQPATAIRGIDKLKNKLFNLIQESIPETPLSSETAEFMQTGVIPPAWLKELFEQDVSWKQLGKMYNLMYFIHIDFYEDKKDERQVHSKNSTDLPEEDDTKNKPKTAERKPYKPRQKKAPKIQSKEMPQAKKKLTECELAEKLFLGFVNSVLGEKTILDLTKLRSLVSQSLIGHTISHSPRNKMLTLYDDTSRPVASFRAKGIEIISG